MNNSLATKEDIRLLLTEIRSLRKLIEASTLDEALTKEACQILRLKNPRHLKQLRTLGQIKNFKKLGKEFYYNKEELFHVRERIAKGEITIVKSPNRLL